MKDATAFYLALLRLICPTCGYLRGECPGHSTEEGAK
jgi:hypothetical protein